MIKIYNKLEEILLAATLLVMVMVNFLNVVSRYFIHASISFTEELLMLLLIWNTMLASALAFKYKSHLGLSAITDLFPQKFQKFVVILSTTATVVLMGTLVKYGIGMLQNQFRFNVRTPVLAMHESIISIAIPIGALLILIRVIEAGYHEIKDLREGDQ